MGESDLPAVSAIADARLGETYEYDLDAVVGETDRVGLVAVVEGDVVGYGFGLDAVSGDRLCEETDEAGIEGPASLLKSVAVREDMEQRGIGTALFQGLVDRLAWPVYGIAWLRDDHHDSSSLFEAAGFRTLCDIERFWYEDSLGKEEYCPDCGAPCTCAARIYVRSSAGSRCSG